jgi:hypothetical protein
MGLLLKYPLYTQMELPFDTRDEVKMVVTRLEYILRELSLLLKQLDDDRTRATLPPVNGVGNGQGKAAVG